MNKTKKIAYHDLREEAQRERLPALVGRRDEIARLDRLLGQRINNNALVVGPSGIGKTALIYGWVRHLSGHPRYDRYALLQLDTEHLYELGSDAALEERYAEAFAHMPACVLFIDDFGRELGKNAALAQHIHRVYKHLLMRPDVHVVLALDPHEHAWLLREYPAFTHLFETLVLKNQTTSEYARILAKKVPLLNSRHRVIVPDDSLLEIVALAERFPSLGQLPRSAIHLLDESVSSCATQEQKILTSEAIIQLVEAKTGVPGARMKQGELQGIKDLADTLNKHIVDQREAIAKIAATLQRAKLGLRNPHRPLGSFLLLGPSGVGKTETAKCVAEIMFGRAESFTRIDMSEFQQEHTVQRLIGAPPGYVGYEEGGALTNALRKEPHSLILLDEIEKAHPKVFDVFLQVLDDGRLTSGQSETIDARHAIFMATSNAAVQEILEAHAQKRHIDDESFVAETVLPILAKTFRLEFINRFDSILVFKPLTVSSLVQVAQLEIRKIEKRLAKHHVRFDIEPHVLEERIRHIADPRFGARPVKRFIEETCETLLMQSLLKEPRHRGAPDFLDEYSRPRKSSAVVLDLPELSTILPEDYSMI
jgi:ATP-dependent Clp protease ATP-binding subunit ClpA